jgi:hypothetical protein
MEEQIIINKTEKPNSYEFGKAGNRFKLYFDTAEDLKQQMNNLILQGLYSEDITKLEDKK